MSVGFGVIGANSFVANAAVMPAIDAARNGHLVAIASRSQAVPSKWSQLDVGTYDAVLDHPGVDVVYIPLPNGMHQEWTERAAAAGKHVLCEKPLASDAATAQAMADSCAAAGVLLAEAWMTPFSLRYRHALDLVRSGTAGTAQTIDARFTFTIGPDAANNYRWDPDQGGGALLDVGIYCLGPIVELFGAAPDHILANVGTEKSGVDASMSAVLEWADGRRGSVTASFVDAERQQLVISSTEGSIAIEAEAFTGGVGDTDVLVQREGQPLVRETVGSNDSYKSMIEALSDAVTGTAEWPRPIERSIEMLQLIDRIRDAATS